MDAIDYEEIRPDVQVAHAIHRAWVTTVHQPVADFLIVPDGCVDVLFSMDGGLQLVGSMTAAQPLPLDAGSVVGVRLRPGAATSWLRLALGEVTDGQVPLRDIVGPAASDLQDLLCHIETPRQQALALCAAVSRSVASRSAGTSVQEQSLQRALQALARTDGDVSVEWLALQSNLSVRQFHRRCVAATGLAPKLLARVLRLTRALRRKQRTSENWTRIAAACGYADQAHFTHDFSSLVGCSPKAYAQSRGDVRFAQATAAAAA